ncbi:hypothetical protein SDC9_186908 [bioreactor metagenome]|uniref:Uncharacterized protein n=1 Tax=bioreactor metagenome TaxID=1076179 RepID=A0A645HKV8_9ZZZZ
MVGLDDQGSFWINLSHRSRGFLSQIIPLQAIFGDHGIVRLIHQVEAPDDLTSLVTFGDLFPYFNELGLRCRVSEDAAACGDVTGAESLPTGGRMKIDDGHDAVFLAP